MDPMQQSDSCNMQERLIELNTEWTLKVRHVDISVISGPIKLIDTNTNRVKLTIVLRPVTDSSLEISQIDPSTLGGSVTGIQFAVVASTQQSYTFSRNIEDDKAECTQAWWAFGTVCLYISEVIYTGNSNRKCTVKVDSSESTECPNSCYCPEECEDGSEQTSDSNSRLNSFRAESSSD